MSPVRVCFLTHYFPPEVGAPQARLSALTAGLAARGMVVTVHTGFPHYPEGRVLEPYGGGLRRRERVGDVAILRTVVAPLPNRGTVGRLIDHSVFAAGALLARRLGGSHDVVVAESPPLFLAVAAIPYARRCGARLVVNIADRWPESVVAVGAMKRGRPITAAESLEARVYGRATAITTPTEGLARALGAHPEATGKVHRLRPVVDLARVAAAPVPRHEGPLRLLYAGTVGLSQSLDTLVDAAALAGPDVVDVTVAGTGAELARLRARTAAEGVGNVHWRGLVPRAEIRGLYERAEAVVVLLRDAALFADALPTKLVEAMASGRPIVLSATGEAARHVERAGCGCVVPPEDPHALAEALRELRGRRGELTQLGELARAHVAAELDPECAIDDWAQLLRRLGSGG